MNTSTGHAIDFYSALKLFAVQKNQRFKGSD